MQNNRIVKHTANKTGNTLSFYLLTFLLIICTPNSEAQDSVLMNYIRTGLENNLALQQKHLSWKKSLTALKKSKALFFPDISLNARYSIAEGGRVIDLPVGDMLNPVYATLNQITSNLQEAGLSDYTFSDTRIENESIHFLRPTEHETKIRLAQPLFNTDIYYNRRISEELAKAEKASLVSYKRELIAEIKTAYFNYLKTTELLELLHQTEKLTRENLRTSQSLFENQKITYDEVLKAKTEQSKLEGRIAEAMKNNKSAAAYFNFLLNRPLEELVIKTKLYKNQQSIPNLEEIKKQALNRREELQMLDHQNQATHENLKLNKAKKLPRVSAVVDYGFQGEEYNFSGEYDYLLASVVLQWNLFSGRKNKAEIQQALIEKNMAQKSYEKAQNQIQLQVINTYYSLEAAYKNIRAVKQEAETAGEVFRMVNKKYGQGQAGMLEFTDAKNAMTSAEQKLIIAKYDFHIKMAELEKAGALLTIPDM